MSELSREQLVAEAEEVNAERTPGVWEWHWRPDDEQAPGSIFAEPPPPPPVNEVK